MARIIYTAITNGYDVISPRNYYNPDVKYVCFTDGQTDVPGPWEVVKIDDWRHPRMNPHLYFDQGDQTIWIDGCYTLTKELLTRVPSFAVLRHGSTFTYLDEMLEGYTCAFFSYDDALRFTLKLKDDGYEFKNYNSPQGTIIWRTINDEIKSFGEVWYEWSNMGINRDNIPFDAATQFTGVVPTYFKRNQCGIELGYFNKTGRRGKHPQLGDKKQYLRMKSFTDSLEIITGLSARLYVRYDEHDFYMRVYGII